MNVLIVEDNLTSALLLLTLVEQLDGFTAASAGSAAEAMDAVSRQRFDVVLMDYLLPDANGLELAHRIRRTPSHRDVAVVMVTSSYEKNLRLACLEAGIAEFLNKPVDVAELRLRLLNIAAAARLRRAAEGSLADALGPLERRLGLPPGTLEPVRRAFASPAIEGAAGEAGAAFRRALAGELAAFAAAVGRLCEAQDAAAPPEPPADTARLSDVVLPRTAPYGESPPAKLVTGSARRASSSRRSASVAGSSE